MHHVAHFLVYNLLAKFQLFCIITCRDILYFVFWLPYCHTLWRHQYLICIIQKFWISLERDEIWQKRKHHSSSLLKGLSNSPFFQYLNFSFHRHFNHLIVIYLAPVVQMFDNAIHRVKHTIHWKAICPGEINIQPLNNSALVDSSGRSRPWARAGGGGCFISCWHFFLLWLILPEL